jgi:multicomponent Na+:H+ antiporter subunit F
MKLKTMQRFKDILCAVELEEDNKIVLERSIIFTKNNIGDITENILNQINCSVLVIELPNFISPVTLRE